MQNGPYGLDLKLCKVHVTFNLSKDRIKVDRRVRVIKICAVLVFVLNARPLLTRSNALIPTSSAVALSFPTFYTAVSTISCASSSSSPLSHPTPFTLSSFH